ncbi:MAG TPA: hypothetical protein VF381_03190 [Thermoanaerobaculia bacterium]
MSNTVPTPNPTPTDTPQPAPGITADALIEQLRSLNSQIPAVTPMTQQERKHMRNRARTSHDVLKASISVIGADGMISQAIGQPPDAVQELVDESVRWQRAEDELRAMLNGVAGANLVRRQRLSALAARACGIGTQLAKDPEHAALVPHVEEVKRLRKIGRRKKPAPTPQTPPPAASPVEAKS